MKSKYITAIFSLGILISLTSCFDAPEYSTVPEIFFDNIRFVDVQGAQDSLILSFNFTDGDGDLGLNNNETNPPYHSFNIILDGSSKFRFNQQLNAEIVIDSTIKFVEFGKTDIQFPLYIVDIFGVLNGIYAQSEIPLPPYNCRDYLITPNLDGDTSGIDKEDTVLIQANPTNKNIILEFYRKRNGQYTNITQNLSPNDCQDSFNARFPIFDAGNIGRPLRGTIYYPMISSAFKAVFLNDSIMIEFYIYDRSLNKSNTIRTKDFTLPGLLGIN